MSDSGQEIGGTSSNNLMNGLNSSHPYPLPFPVVWRPSIPASDGAPVNPGALMESCGSKVIMGIVTGAGCGLLFGMFLGAMGDMQPVQLLHGREVPQLPLKEQMRAAYVSTSQRSTSMAKSFAGFSALLLGNVMNSLYAGCITGATFGAKSGPQAMCLGCGGMAAFTLVIDRIMGH